jgi:hypothetical protein
MTFLILPECLPLIRWSDRGSCGNSGCSDPECCCALCAKPIGVSEDDPRWDEHSEFCDDCELCRDGVPIMLFRGEGAATEQAQFHQACFERVAKFADAPQLQGGAKPQNPKKGK